MCDDNNKIKIEFITKAFNNVVMILEHDLDNLPQSFEIIVFIIEHGLIDTCEIDESLDNLLIVLIKYSD